MTFPDNDDLSKKAIRSNSQKLVLERLGTVKNDLETLLIFPYLY
ncbi:hypothetical protein ScFU97_07210 [Streptococcus canis]|uniref:Uncharacterized protein n=1 Tax=Streptococcus canis FSL Z3-227 TaxID=482234 RepID=A0AAV3FR81_STRCB|nr:hypothetical protein [Streptococcus canis]EIQ81627.1 hypothetical protein SCAZ3_04385 [Streptococcus canis FSL Z3-227]MDW7796669.1 hypothetical protein [Streptococcus canis]GAY70592.1 uncharacterized protein TANIYAMA4_1011 [Streptococcus canis]GEE06326.1 hypothetical protein ScOT1_04190 [Streptococcus canis]GFE43761.1 hypothetical protein ScFU1_14420 [Streptococcus canis]